MIIEKKNKKPRASSDWIVVNFKDQPAVQQCERCGDTAPMPFNVNWDYASDLMKAFVRFHKKCKIKV